MRKIDSENTILLGEIFESIENLSESSKYVHRISSGTGQVALKEIFGIEVRSSHVHSPFVDRPVLQQSCELALQSGHSGKSIEVCYLERIGRVLGKPLSISTKPTGNGHDIRHYSKWRRDDFRITLSIYGSERDTPSGPATAGLFFDLIDLVAVAAPFLRDRQQLESSYWSDLREVDVMYSTISRNNYRPFSIRDYESDVSGLAIIPTLERVSQKALYTRELLETPEIVLQWTPTSDILIWRHGGRFFLSVKNDTICLSNELSKFAFNYIEPARGRGGKELVINEIVLREDTDSFILRSLEAAIEKIVKKPAVQNRYEDS